MAKIGVNIKIDVTKIDKAKLYKGQKGTYLDAVAFIELDETDQYGNSGMIKQQAPKGEDGAILGNTKIFWRDDTPSQQAAPAPQRSPQVGPANTDFDQDIPF